MLLISRSEALALLNSLRQAMPKPTPICNTNKAYTNNKYRSIYIRVTGDEGTCGVIRRVPTG